MNALTAGSGKNNVYFKCDSRNGLHEVWYYHYLRGPFSNGNFVPIDYATNSQCPQDGIYFYPKGLSSKPRPPSDPSGPSGYLRLSDHSGCLISNGNYHENGSCAKFTVVLLQFGGYYIISSKGVCGFNDVGYFVCNRLNKPSQFQFGYDSNSNEILYGNKNDWCLKDRNSRGSVDFTQTPVLIADETCKLFKIMLSS